MAEAAKKTVTVSGHEIGLTRRDKLLFPESGLTKGDLVDYYRRVAPLALPHLRDRPLSLQRFPDGVAEPGFYQKDLPDYFPDWIGRVSLAKEDGRVTHVVASDAATLVYLANQACVTLHAGLARNDRPERPDRMILDLDPSDDDFDKLREAARAARDLLEELKLASFLQLTGSRGLHVVVPLDRSAGFDAVRDFAHGLGRCLAARHPALMTVEHRKAKRGARVFVDYLRNGYGQTAVAPYSVRAIEGAPVATPLRWDELGAGDLTPRKYGIGNLFRRLSQVEDPWSGMARHAVALEAARERFAVLA